MEADEHWRTTEEGRKPDVGFKSKESEQLLEYLRTAQRAQFRLICIRVSFRIKMYDIFWWALVGSHAIHCSSEVNPQSAGGQNS